MAGYMSQGMSKAATASAAHDHRRPGDVRYPLLSGQSREAA